VKLIEHLFLAASIVSMLSVAPFARGNVILTNTTSFSTSNGIHPSAGLIQGNDGNFYGTTEYGGTSGGFGAVFKITPAGTLTTLVSFNNSNGAYPTAGLVQGGDGNFYGTTSAGGTNGGFGTVFKMTPAGALTTIFSFDNTRGANPYGGLVQDANGNLYGAAAYGGPYIEQDDNGLGYGTVFELTTNGTFTNLYMFTGSTDGFYPLTGLTLGNDGNLYGTTAEADTFGDPAFGAGTVFRITSGGVFTNLVSFNYTNGANPYAGLVQTGDGNFYGTTYNGGDANAGTVFQMTPTGTLNYVVSFNNLNGANPYGALVPGSDGNLYGTTELGGTNDYGTVFQMTPAGALQCLLSFDYFSNGANPTAGLFQVTNGAFYGTTYSGGSHGGGTIFHLTVPMPPVFQKVRRTGSMLTFTWSGMPGQTYQVLYKTNWNQTNWSNLGAPITATSTSTSVSDSMLQDPHRFYRILVMP
jgi:uncharacterized repeat protein (TIGR03803 family)